MNPHLDKNLENPHLDKNVSKVYYRQMQNLLDVFPAAFVCQSQFL